MPFLTPNQQHQSTEGWISTFLTSRRQSVVVDRVFSNSTYVLSGIPHGSVLGPLLFIIYINDLVDSCCDDVNIYLFADDAKLYAHIKSEQDELGG